MRGITLMARRSQKLYVKICRVLFRESGYMCEDLDFNYGLAMKAINHDPEALVVAKKFCNIVLRRLNIHYDIDHYKVDGDYNPMLYQILTIFMLVWVDIDVDTYYENKDFASK